MIKSILIAVASAFVAAPAISVPISQASLSNDTPPSIVVSIVDTPSSFYCRTKARSKYFELGARDISNEDSNSQWAVVGRSRSLVWCRGTQAIVIVTGSNYTAIDELRDELKKAF